MKFKCEICNMEFNSNMHIISILMVNINKLKYYTIKIKK